MSIVAPKGRKHLSADALFRLVRSGFATLPDYRPDDVDISLADALMSAFAINWLRVLDTAERSQIDQRVCHQLHAIVPLLDAFKSEQQPLELIFPGKGPFDTHPQRMDRFIE